MNPVFASIHIAAPETILTAGAMLTLMIGVFRGDRSLVPLTGVCIFILALAGFAVIALPAGATLAFGGLYIADGFSAFLKVLIIAAAAVSMALALPYWRGGASGNGGAGGTGGARFEYPVLLMLSTLGMTIMVSAHDLLTLYIGLELQSLAAYVLASFNRGESRSSEAGLKYFVLGALASGILLFGVSLAYGFAGSTGFAAIADV